jgi:hypothetical protein
MKLIHYAGETLLTGDAIADAVLKYASALASCEESATIAIPVRLSSGAIADANLLVGPASQLVAVPQESALGEIVDEALLARIDREVGLLSNGRPQTEIPSNGSAHTIEGSSVTGVPNDWEL